MQHCMLMLMSTESRLIHDHLHVTKCLHCTGFFLAPASLTLLYPCNYRQAFYYGSQCPFVVVCCTPLLQCKDGIAVSESHHVTSTTNEATITILTLCCVQQLVIWCLLIRYGGHRQWTYLWMKERIQIYSLQLWWAWWYVLNISESLRLFSHLAL